MYRLQGRNKELICFYLLAGLFILGFLYYVRGNSGHFYIYGAIPIFLLIISIFFFSFDKFLLLIVFCTPFALTLKEMGVEMDLDLSLPTEPLMALTLLILPVYQLYQGIISKNWLRHPVTIIIFLQLIWMSVSCIGSEMPLVSVKYLIARLWFISSSYFLMGYLFQKDTRNVKCFLWLYILPLSAVCIFILIQHAGFNFDEHVADWITSPFYNDHTAYGAALAMYIPVLISWIFIKKSSQFQRIATILCLAILSIALFFSFARAAWIGIVASIFLIVFFLFRIRFRTLLIFSVSALVIAFAFQSNLVMLLSRNSTASGGDAVQEVESMTNIKTDDSNLERLNRWSCAIKMFEEHPFMGWGPGTYMFQYAPFQKANEKSKISTNAGTNGNAHSELLGPLSEQGLPGMLLMLSLMGAVFYYGFRVVYGAESHSDKLLAMGIICGFCTYFIHGFLNNFLDTDKLSLPFWGFIAALVQMDISQRNKSKAPSNNITSDRLS